MEDALRSQDRQRIRQMFLERQVNERQLQPGAEVELRGLTARPELNGKFGTVLAVVNDRGRLTVEIEDVGEFALKPGNLVLRSATVAAAPVATMSKIDDEANFECSICFSLLYKPCVNACGHCFCFWCLHQIMDSFQDSHCPLCRASFSQLAFPCVPLHRFLTEKFVASMAAREREVTKMEREQFHAQSPSIPRAPSTTIDFVQESKPSRSAAAIRSEDFLCSACFEIPENPVVLSSCGHIVCQRCLTRTRPDDTMASTVRSAAEHDGKLRETICPACATPTLSPDGVLGVCSLLQVLLEECRRHPPTTEKVEMARLKHRKVEQKSVGRTASMSEGDRFVHYGIGCDGCGICPVVGRCFKCLDCPDQIGYDLCDRCAQRNERGELRERGCFNQVHLSTHRMEERPQISGFLHELVTAHPELTPTQIIQWLQQQRNFDEATDQTD